MRERVVELVGIALTDNPTLVYELYTHLAEPVCQRCGAPPIASTSTATCSATS